MLLAEMNKVACLVAGYSAQWYSLVACCCSLRLFLISDVVDLMTWLGLLTDDDAWGSWRFFSVWKMSEDTGTDRLLETLL